MKYFATDSPLGRIIENLIANYEGSEEHQITPEKYNQWSLILNRIYSSFMVHLKGDRVYIFNSNKAQR